MTKTSGISPVQNHTVTTFSQIGIYPLSEPITFSVYYDTCDQQWCIVNEELALYGYGNTCTRAMECLEEDLESHIISFTEYPGEKHSDDSLLLKRRLCSHIDFSAAKRLLDEKYCKNSPPENT